MYLRHRTVKKNGKTHSYWSLLCFLRERTARQAVAWQHYNLVLPLTDGTELGLRCVVRPEEAQAALLDRLGLKLPRRLRMPRM